tara:strand:+ start:150 stop:350 length:201 start_codon:yes stop_codon:yes gene_type:complete
MPMPIPKTEDLENPPPVPPSPPSPPESPGTTFKCDLTRCARIACAVVVVGGLAAIGFVYYIQENEA